MFRNFATPQQLATLSTAVAAYCEKHQIKHEDARERIALRVFFLFQQGASSIEEIKAGLEGNTAGFARERGSNDRHLLAQLNSAGAYLQRRSLREVSGDPPIT